MPTRPGLGPAKLHPGITQNTGRTTCDVCRIEDKQLYSVTGLSSLIEQDDIGLECKQIMQKITT